MDVHMQAAVKARCPAADLAEGSGTWIWLGMLQTSLALQACLASAAEQAVRNDSLVQGQSQHQLQSVTA